MRGIIRHRCDRVPELLVLCIEPGELRRAEMIETPRLDP